MRIGTWDWFDLCPPGTLLIHSLKFHSGLKGACATSVIPSIDNIQHSIAPSCAIRSCLGYTAKACRISFENALCFPLVSTKGLEWVKLTALISPRVPTKRLITPMDHSSTLHRLHNPAVLKPRKGSGFWKHAFKAWGEVVKRWDSVPRMGIDVLHQC